MLKEHLPHQWLNVCYSSILESQKTLSQTKMSTAVPRYCRPEVQKGGGVWLFYTLQIWSRHQHVTNMLLYCITYFLFNRTWITISKSKISYQLVTLLHRTWVFKPKLKSTLPRDFHKARKWSGNMVQFVALKSCVPWINLRNHFPHTLSKRTWRLNWWRLHVKL